MNIVITGYDASKWAESYKETGDGANPVENPSFPRVQSLNELQRRTEESLTATNALLCAKIITNIDAMMCTVPASRTFAYQPVTLQ